MNSEYKTCVLGIANGSNALSYMSFVAAIITLGKLISTKTHNISGKLKSTSAFSFILSVLALTNLITSVLNINNNINANNNNNNQVGHNYKGNSKTYWTR